MQVMSLYGMNIRNRGITLITLLKLQNQDISIELKRQILGIMTKNKFWTTIKYYMKGNRSAHKPPLLKRSDVGCTEHVYTDIEKATVLNEYFTSIYNFTNIPDSLPDFEQKTNDTLDSINTSQQDILDAIHTLKIDKAPGIDGISNRLLKVT